MSLANLIRGRSESGRFATATVATFATEEGVRGRTVASVATVAVATSSQGSRRDTATASRWWLLYYRNRDPEAVGSCPEASHAEMLERHPDAIAAEPFTPTIRQPSAPLVANEETAIRAWLALIDETDPAIIAEVIGQCQRDADAREYFTGRAESELPKPHSSVDDPRTCGQCANLVALRCQAAERGDIGASQKYEPICDLPRRCEGDAPGMDDRDKRYGRDRWPGLAQKGGE